MIIYMLGKDIHLYTYKIPKFIEKSKIMTIKGEFCRLASTFVYSCYLQMRFGNENAQNTFGTIAYISRFAFKTLLKRCQCNEARRKITKCEMIFGFTPFSYQ